MLFLSKNRDINRLKFGVTFLFAYPSSINGSDEILVCESSPLNNICFITNGAPITCIYNLISYPN